MRSCGKTSVRLTNRCHGTHRVFVIPFTFIILYRIYVVLICNVSVLQQTHVYIKLKTPWHTIHQFKTYLSFSSFVRSNLFKYPPLLYTSQHQYGNRGADVRYKSLINGWQQNITSNDDVQYLQLKFSKKKWVHRVSFDWQRHITD